MLPKFFLMAFFLPSLLWATTFNLMPLDKLVEEANSAAEVELKGKRSFVNQMGLIVTEYVFKVNEAYNLEETYLDGEDLKLTLSGGSVGGITAYVDGAPEFSEGEKSFLLLKKIESKIYLSNFTMGKYKVEEAQGKTYYVSSVFPSDPDVGRVSKDRMLGLVREKFKIAEQVQVLKDLPKTSSLKERKLFKRKAGEAGRSIAQENAEENRGNEGLWAMWIFFALGAACGVGIWKKLKEGPRE